MKKILNGPTVWRAKCPVCDCEFEYDVSETIKVYDKTTLDVFRINIPPILLSIRELFINGIGHSYITLYSDELSDVQIIRDYHKEF